MENKLIHKNTKHGMTKHRLYDVWKQIKYRCTNPKSKYYKNYGGRGITISKEWLDVNNFINDMYPSYKEGLSIDRIDNDKGYCSNNCRWANRSVQSRNTRQIRTSNKSSYRGVSWCKRTKKWLCQIQVSYKKNKYRIF